MIEMTNMDKGLTGFDKQAVEHKEKLNDLRKQADEIKEKLKDFDLHVKRIEGLKSFAEMTGQKLEKG